MLLAAGCMEALEEWLWHAKMKKTILLLIAFVILIGLVILVSAGSYPQYQETADEIGCEGTWEPLAGCTNTTDGKWNSWGGATFLNNHAYLYVNYTKPFSSLNLSLWQTKSSGFFGNLSIDSGCWSQSILQFKVDSYASVSPEVDWYCWDGGDWILLKQDTIQRSIYEEAMWWDITQESSFQSSKPQLQLQAGNKITIGANKKIKIK